MNIAARVEQTAPAGALRVSQDTYTQVRGVFDVVPQDPMTVKGVDAPVTSCLVERLKPRAFRAETCGIAGVATRMIGRDAEFEVPQDAFMRLVQTGSSLEHVTVVAEACVDKSHLLYEFRHWAEVRTESFFVVQASAAPQTQGQTHGLLRDVLAWRFEISDGDSMEVAKKKLEAGLMPLFVADEGKAEAHAHLLGQLLGLDDNDSKHISDIKDTLAHVEADAAHELRRRSQRELVNMTDADNRSDDVRKRAFRNQVLHQVTYDTMFKRIKRDAHTTTAQRPAEHSGTRAKRCSALPKNTTSGPATTFMQPSSTPALAKTLRAPTPTKQPSNTRRVRCIWRPPTRTHYAGACTPTATSPTTCWASGPGMQDIESLVALAEALDDDARRAEAALRLGSIAYRTAGFEIAGTEAHRAELLAQKAGNEELELLSARMRAGSLIHADVAAARTMAEAALARHSVRPGDYAELPVQRAVLLHEHERRLVGSPTRQRACSVVGSPERQSTLGSHRNEQCGSDSL